MTQAPQDYSDLPEKTKTRSERYKDAAWLFIHNGVTKVPELARRTGINANRLYCIAREDGWREYRAMLRARTASSMWVAGGIEAAWTEGDLDRIQLEVVKQSNAAQALQAQRDALLVLLTKTDARTPKYATLLGNLDKLTALITRFVQLDTWREEQAERRAKRNKTGKGDMPASPAKPESRTVLLDAVGDEVHDAEPEEVEPGEDEKQDGVG